MIKRDKLIQKILDEADITFEEAQKVLILSGYHPAAPNSGSSHITFRKSEKEKNTLVRTQNPVKKYILKQIKEAVLNG